MKLALLAAMAATTNAKCRTSYADATEPASCVCNAACTTCIGAANDTATTALATACWKGSCADATPFFTAKNTAVGNAAVVEPNLGTCGNAVCAPAVETIATVERTTACVAPFIGAATDKIDYSAERVDGTRKFEGYRGRQNKTRTGKTCQAWNTKAPKSHSYTPDAYPLKGLEQNFCRDPSNNGYLWCYTGTTYEKCDPLEKPACKGIEDCYETEFAEGCCAEMTVSAGYAPTADQKKYGYTTGVFWNGTAPAAGAKASTCVSKAAAAEYAGSLTTGTAFQSNMSVALENIRKGDGGNIDGKPVADKAALWTLLDTDDATQAALLIDLTCLKTEESAMKVAASATVALIAAALI